MDEKTTHIQKSGELPATVLLIDDQAMVGEAVRRMLAEATDIVFHFCQDPTQAMATAKQVKPTVILQDLVMPRVDGMTLVKFFRANPDTRDIPLIVLSSKEEPVTKAQAFSLGASDYLVKLPDKIELLARIRHHSQGYINLVQRNQVMAQLQQELDTAANYVTGILPPPLDEGPVRSSWRFVPSSSLGGDAFGYHWLDDNRFAIYLLDVCGHGVGAALLSVSAMNVLRSQSLPDTDFNEPSQVLSALNEAFDMDRQNSMYFTMWYGVWDQSTRLLKYASGGHPPALWLPRDGEIQRLMTKNMIIGGMPGLPFQQAEILLDQPGRLTVFSDGVYEITRPDGSLWTLDEFVDFMAQPPRPGESLLDTLLQHVRDMSELEILDDDFSIVEIELPA